MQLPLFVCVCVGGGRPIRTRLIIVMISELEIPLALDTACLSYEDGQRGEEKTSQYEMQQ